MRITILDGGAGGLGAMLKSPLENLGLEVQTYDRTANEELLERAADSPLILTNKVPLGAKEMDRLKSLKYIGVMATGYNIIDTAAARMRGITVTNVPAYSSDSVAQMTWAHILNISSRVGSYSQKVRQGVWCQSADFCMLLDSITELSGKTLGIIGLGDIGSRVARIALAFGMKVLALTSKPQERIMEGVRSVPLDELLTGSDIVSLHCPQTPENLKMVNLKFLESMKPTAILINTARGGLIDEKDLAKALGSGTIRAAGMDVATMEPMREDSPLWRLENCYFTPHIAWASSEARERLVSVIVDNVRSFLKGESINRV